MTVGIHGYTAVYKFILTDFDYDPWHTFEWQNWQVLDALVSKFIGINNIQGVWQNSTAYTANQRLIDSTDGTIWNCLVNNTSAAGPTTFSADRIAHPTYWQNVSNPLRWKGNWAPATVYQSGDIVIVAANNIIYVANSNHTSAGSFAADSTNWDTLADFSVPVGNATTQATNAANSATNAANSATLAQNWATQLVTTVDGVNYSAKYEALLAQAWAIQLVTTVDGVNYSAKYWALQAQAITVLPFPTLAAAGLPLVVNPAGTAYILGNFSPLYRSDGGVYSPAIYALDSRAAWTTNFKLEAAPTNGDTYYIRDVYGKFGTNPVTIDGNGKQLGTVLYGYFNTVIFNLPALSVGIQYHSDTDKWELF